VQGHDKQVGFFKKNSPFPHEKKEMNVTLEWKYSCMGYPCGRPLWMLF